MVHLRAIEIEDVEELYQIENDSTHWDIGETNVPYSKATLHEYIINSRNDIFADRQVRLMVEDERKNIVGIVDVINFDPRHLRAEIGIIVKKEYRRNGIATDAINKIKDYALRIWHVHQLYAIVPEDNVASIKLFEKCGFITSHSLKDWLFDGKQYHSALHMQLFL